MTHACSEYLLSLARTVGAVDIDMVPELIRACEQSIDLAWVVTFYIILLTWLWISNKGCRRAADFWCSKTSVSVCVCIWLLNGHTCTRATRVVVSSLVGEINPLLDLPLQFR